MKKHMILLLLTLFPHLAFGQGEVTKVGTTAANFLNLEIGARAIALAGAYTPISNDGASLKWNPAGLVDVQGMTATYHNVNMYLDIKHQFVGLLVPIGREMAFGVSFDYVDIGKIERTTEFAQEGMGLYFSNFDMAIGASFSRRLTDRVSFGLNVRWVHEQIWQEKADGVSADIGLLFSPGLRGLRLGMSITNFGPDMAMDKGPLQTFYRQPPEEGIGVGNRPVESRYMVESYPMPTSFQMGAALEILGQNSVLLKSDENRIMAIVEVNDAFDNPMRSKWALEYGWNNTFFLRMGYKLSYDLARFSFGAGLRIPLPGFALQIDYATAEFGDLGNIHTTSLELVF